MDTDGLEILIDGDLMSSRLTELLLRCDREPDTAGSRVDCVCVTLSRSHNEICEKGALRIAQTLNDSKLALLDLRRVRCQIRSRCVV